MRSRTTSGGRSGAPPTEAVVESGSHIGLSPRATLTVIFLIAALVGGNYTALKFALEHAPPLLLTSLRTIVGGAFLMSFALLRGERLPTRRYDYVSIMLVSVCITTLSSLTLVMAVSRVSAGVAALLSSTMPMFTELFAAVVLHERLRGMALGGLFTGFVGAVVLALPALAGDTSLVGVLLLLVATSSWAMGTVVMKIRDLSQVSPIMLVAVQLFMSATVLFPLGLAVEGLDDVDWSIGLAIPLFYAAVPAMAISFALMATIVRQAPAAQAASPAYLIPVFGVFLAWLIRGDGLELIEFIGGALVVAGVFLLSTASVRQQTPEQTPADTRH
jgi:drug/metabolite transporter (DMT)-like permease